jgi:hypothetical protein
VLEEEEAVVAEAGVLEADHGLGIASEPQVERFSHVSEAFAAVPVLAPLAVASAPAPPPPPAAASSVASPSSSAASPASFADLAAHEELPAAAPSESAGVPVPVDMVEKIAQRVVAQISEKTVREIAWEVIPDLAETLIKQEIERLKAELQKT